MSKLKGAKDTSATEQNFQIRPPFSKKFKPGAVKVNNFSGFPHFDLRPMKPFSLNYDKNEKWLETTSPSYLILSKIMEWWRDYSGLKQNTGEHPKFL